MSDFTIPDLECIEDAVRARIEDLEQQAAHMDDVAKAIGSGQKVAPFAEGEAGVKAASGLAQDKRARIDQLRVILGKTKWKLGNDW